MNRTLILAALSLSMVGAAAAQRIEGRFEAGVTSFADEGAVNHLTLGGSLRAYLSRRWSVDPEFLYMRHNGGFVRDRDYLLWGNLAVDFRDRDRGVVPYWFAAPGLVHHRSTFGSQTFSTSEAAVATGAGVRFVSDRVFVAPQVRFGLADGVFVEFTGSIGFILRR